MSKVSISSDLKELVEEYMDDMKIEAEEFQKKLESKDYVAISRMAHKVKGNAGSYGFDELGEIGAKLEVAALKMEVEDISKGVTAFCQYIKEVEILYE